MRNIINMNHLPIIKPFCLFYILLFNFSLACRSQDMASQTVIANDVVIRPVTDDVFIHISFRNSEDSGRIPANGLIVKTSQGLVMIDTPWDIHQTDTLMNWLFTNYSATISACIVTHSHDDCMGGLKAIQKQQIKSYACLGTVNDCKIKTLPIPENPFQDSLILNFNNKTIIAYYPGAGHSEDNIVVYIKEDQVLFGGCLIKNLKATNPGNTKDAVIAEWPGSVKNVKNRFPDAKIIVPGHGNHGGPELFDHTINILTNSP